MPGNVSTASPAVVLPKALCSAFTLTLEFPIGLNVYKSGEFQAKLLVDNARRTWSQTRRLTATLSDALLTFYVARKGGAEAFWFYDPFEASGAMGTNWDVTGTVTTGRYAVRFQGGFAQGQQKPGRIASEFILREIA